MKDCKNITSKFDLALYGELTKEERKYFEEHLSECEKCADEFNALKETLSIINERKSTEPDEEFMNNFWNELNPKLEKATVIDKIKDILQQIFTGSSRLSYQLAAGFTILLLGIIIGRFLLIDSPDSNGILIPNTQQNESIIQARAERYIDRSKVLLLGLMNYESGDYENINFTREQKVSQELITEAALLKNDMKSSSDLQLRRLINEIEVILMQIANLEEQQDIDGIELIKDGVDRRGIFLKINIRELKNSSQSGDATSEQTNKNENNT
jgi:hypothetical protein